MVPVTAERGHNSFGCGQEAQRTRRDAGNLLLLIWLGHPNEPVVPSNHLCLWFSGFGALDEVGITTVAPRDRSSSTDGAAPTRRAPVGNVFVRLCMMSADQ
ncbi:hypothetical protein BP6252_04079 [Coleophoma cylindrospora]|uniref:Uncharacterized protein n=1 Tax=Coleophoma cylindrospora TaxID=1849047 RepID=A0A3D8S042_9HELO|nr:hypothetical protein BP6252_04079 [Coleophoma cylindrospora]